MDDISIRPAQRDDIQAICRLSNVINTEHHAHVPDEFLAADRVDRDAEFWLQTLDDDDNTILVAEIEHDVIGLVALTVKSLRGRTGSVVSRRSYRRAYQYRGRCPGSPPPGGGRRLFEAATEHARAHQATELRLDIMAFNKPARRFYAELGFEPLSHTLSRPLEVA